MRTLVYHVCLVIAMAVCLSGALAYAEAFFASPPPASGLTASRAAAQGRLGGATLRKTEKPVYTLPEREHTRRDGGAFMRSTRPS
jgi:hypothetical protein